MKKVLSLLLCVGMLLTMTACSNGEKEESVSGIDNSEQINADENVSDDTVQETEEVKEKYLMHIEAWQDNMYYGYVYVNDRSQFGMVDENGKLLFFLEDGKSFTKNSLSQTGFYGEYALLEDDTVIDKKGNEIFSLADTDFDKIIYAECLDVGYLICSKDVNSFEETGTHYYSVNIVDGSAIKFEGDFQPAPDSCYYYFGNGRFVHASPNMGYGGPHKWYNITTDTYYDGYRIGDNGEEITDRLPDIYFMDGFKNDYSTKSTLDGILYGLNGNSVIKYHTDTGYCETIGVGEIVGVEDASVKDTTREDHLFKTEYTSYDSVQERYITNTLLLNIKTGTCISMDDYKDYEIYKEKDDGTYLALITNEGGGTFATVLSAEGEICFEPIAAEKITNYNSSYFMIQTEEKNFTVYDWQGNEIFTFGALDHYAWGSSSIVSQEDCKDGDCFILYDFTSGEEINLSEKTELGPHDLNGYGKGRYVFDTVLIDEYGEVYETNVEM